ncbi:MAG: replication-associated recombination protein A [Pseudomonadota bacterium]|nr:replication-associated recombination protein A [Pseudomonadota bacterium]
MSIDWNTPLAERIRPRGLEEVAGQTHLLRAGKPLHRVLTGGQLHSMILWGPPGSGKTTLARLLAKHGGAEFLTLSAVTSGVKEIREAIKTAQGIRAQGGAALLFIDEAHRFNKAQQDAFLPHIENGTIVFVGATTENPAFELNHALLSRARVYVLQALSVEEIEALLCSAVKNESRGLGTLNLALEDDALSLLALAADGDARRALNFLETSVDIAAAGAGQDEDQGEEEQSGVRITEPVVRQVITARHPRFDKRGDQFYDQISALHKSIRGSNPDAALYWASRILEGGCDPRYLLRRLVRIVSEDIGNADPKALQLTLSAWDAWDRLGSPEGELAVMQAVVYLAVLPKSNALYAAHKAVLRDVREYPAQEVPAHLRNAPTRLAKQLGHGQHYRYAHDEQHGELGGYAAGETYFPAAMGERRYYSPTRNGLERNIAERLARLRELDREAGEDREH